MIKDSKTVAFLKKHSIHLNRFYGKCIQSTTSDNNLLVDIISKEEGNLLLKTNGDRLTLLAKSGEFSFDLDQFYEFSIFLPYSMTDEQKVFIDFHNNPPQRISFNPYKEIIRLRYERLDNPEANRMIAHLMREIGRGLYSSKQRMIFELLQNADDTPAGDEVSFHIDAHYDYLLFMHNGIPFNKEDVEAITSAAESTKKHDRKKTGYKGIGFKSVFTDSDEVIIKSASFLFAFRRNHTAFKDFDNFYFGKKRYKDYPDLLAEDQLKYERQRRSFNGNLDIPWQLVPVWLDELPSILNNSRLAQHNNNVGIAIKFGNDKIQEYLKAVQNFTSHPEFMLFLRHINLFKSFKNGITVRRIGHNPVKIEKSTSNGEFLSSSYFKKIIDDIEVSDSAISEEGIHIFKKEKINDYGESLYYFSYDREGYRPIDTIPPKIASFNTTSIVFAAPIIDNKLQAEPTYFKGILASSFFTYLPMKETRIRLPFLVNADFVPSSNREELQGDNEWNAYIISKIARNHVKWIAEIANLGLSANKVHSEYLSLLLKESIPDDDSIQLLIDKYNYNYSTSLEETAFILSEKGILIKKSEVILDETGIEKIIDKDTFYEISLSDKHLPHPGINNSYLKYEYLRIERYLPEQLIKDLEIDAKKGPFIEKIKILEDIQYVSFLEWLDSFCYKNDVSEKWVLDLPFIKINERVHSLKEVLEDKTFFVKTKKIEPIEHILEKLGFETTSFYFDEIPNIFKMVDNLDNYLTKDLYLYGLLSENDGLINLGPEDKANLINFCKSLENVGEVKYAENLYLFRSKKNHTILRPLGQLISNSCSNIPTWLDHLVIDPEEESKLPDGFSKFLIKSDKIFVKVFCNAELFDDLLVRLQPVNIDSFYQFISKIYKEKVPSDKPNIAGIPWIFSSKTNTFQSPEKVFFHDSLFDLDKNEYLNIKSVIEECSEVLLPDPSAINIIREFSLGCKKDSLDRIVTKSSDFEVEKIKSFLSWLTDKHERDFLKRFNFIKTESDTISFINSNGIFQYFTKDDNLKSTISNDQVLKQKLCLISTELYNDKLHEIGLIEKNELLEFALTNGDVTKSYVQFLSNETPMKVKELFIEKLSFIDLITGVKYNKETIEHKIFELVLTLGKSNEGEGIFEKAIGKISINGQSINAKNISDSIVFKIKRSDKEESYELKLSDIFEDHSDQTAIVTAIAESFADLNVSELKNKLFKLKREKHSRILEKLNTLPCDYFSPLQVLFLLLYKEENGITESIGKRPSFHTYLYDKDKFKYWTKVQEFVEICYKKDYTLFSDRINIKEFTPMNMVLSEEFSIPEENIPQWLEKWMTVEDFEKKKKYLQSIGINGDDSCIVNLRKAIQSKDIEAINKSLFNIENATLLRNTLQWIKTQSENGCLRLESGILQQLYARVAYKKVPFSNILIPVISGFINDNPIYSLECHKQGNIYHKIHQGWGVFRKEIIEFITTSGHFLVDDIIPKEYDSELKPYKLSVSSVLSEEELKSNSYLFDEPYYLEWEQKNNYPIFLFRGRALPREIHYNSKALRKVFEGTIAKLENAIYLVEDEKRDILYALKGQIPDTVRNQLIEREIEYRKKKRVEFESCNYSEEENSALKRLFGDEIPKEFFKDLNLAALIKGLIFLQQNGYYVSKAEENLASTHSSAQLYPVYAPGANVESSTPLTVKCRSAKSGLLYLRASTWNELLNPNVLMYVLTGNGLNEYRFCKTRDELINDSKADYQIIRIEATSKPENIDSILKGEFDWKSIRIVIRMNNTAYRSIFEKIGEKQESDQIDDIKVGNESED